MNWRQSFEVEPEEDFSPLQKDLFDAHEREAKRMHAEFYNFGCGLGEDFITSKTSKGILHSEISSETGRVTHGWSQQ